MCYLVFKIFTEKQHQAPTSADVQPMAGIIVSLKMYNISKTKLQYVPNTSLVCCSWLTNSHLCKKNLYKI